MLNKTIIIIFFIALLFPASSIAQEEVDDLNYEEKIFKAGVIKVLEEKNIERADGSTALQQNLLLRGFEKEWRNKEVTFYGISDIDMAGANNYRVGDTVLVSEVKNIDGQIDYYIIDLVRTGYLFWLAAIFVLVIVIIGKKKGFKALLSLVVSFIVIVKFIVPNILNGSSPIVAGVLGSLIIMAVIIYITEGWNKKSHISIASVFLALIIIFCLSSIFTYLTRLTGLAEEEAVFLLGSSGGLIDFKGLLLAGILIGAVGVLDDIIVGQVESVKQISLANPNLSKREVFKSAYEVGNTHLGAIVNTLFLTYTGASLPLLLLFYINPTGTVSFGQVINNELIATEIVRTLVGSIGVALAMPISTILAVTYYKKTRQQAD